MRSFLCIEKTEGTRVACEVESIPSYLSTPDIYGKVDCDYVTLPVSLFFDKQFPVAEGNIYVVEHAGKNVTEVLELDEDEKLRREERIRELMNH